MTYTQPAFKSPNKTTTLKRLKLIRDNGYYCKSRIIRYHASEVDEMIAMREGREAARQLKFQGFDDEEIHGWRRDAW